MSTQKIVGYDVTGQNLMAGAVLELLGNYPGLNGREIRFEELGESGIAFSADNGALIISERRSITDHVVQKCQYPFFVVYRSTSTKEYQKLQVQKFFDTLGKWICKEPVEINGVTHRLTAYPQLSSGRSITAVTRSNFYGLEPNEDGVQDWLMPVTVQYTHEFDMW